MDYKKLAESAAHVALEKTFEGKNISEIAESTLEQVAQELTPMGSENSTQEIQTPTERNTSNIISVVVSLIRYFLKKLF